MIHFQHLSVRYPSGKMALDRITTTIKTGEMVVVTGASGSGKTTLLKTIALIERPTSGVLMINGKDMASVPAARVPYYRRNLGLIFQDQKLFSDRTLLENLTFPLEIIGFSRHDAVTRAWSALERVDLQDRASDYPDNLSGGEQKSLCIARAIANRPTILLADEPFLNLDVQMAKKVLSMFKTISQVGITVVITSNIQLENKGSQERVLKLEAGVLVECE